MNGRLLLLPEGDKIKALRLGMGLGERECARFMGISRETLRSMEESNYVSKRSAVAAANFFGVDLDALFMFKGELAEISGAA